MRPRGGGVILAAAVLALAATASAQVVRPTIQQLATQAADLERMLRAQRDPAERKRLTQEIEKVRHQMGPYDLSGARIRCQAMWHDAALAALEVDVKRLTTRAVGDPTSVELRLACRRMAFACLVQGWRIYDGSIKYQVDAFGQYLTNNAATLDAFCEAVGAWVGRAAKGDGAPEDLAALKAAAEKIKPAVEQMMEAALAMGKVGPEREAELPAALADFLAGLRAVHDVHEALQEQVRRKAAGPGEAPDAASVEPAEPPAPPMTPEEQTRLARVKKRAAALTGEAWTATARSLERYALAAENGFQVGSARSRARELLDHLDRASRLAEGLHAAEAANPEYVKRRLREFDLAFEMVESPLTRSQGYAKLGEMWQQDQARRTLEGARLSAEAARGLIYAHYVASVPRATEDDPAALDLARQIRQHSAAVVDGLERMAASPPRDLGPALVPCCKAQEAAFRSALEEGGRAFPADPATGAGRLAAAADRLIDLDLILRADQAVKAVAKYRPAKASAMYGQVATAAQNLVAQQAAPAVARQTLSALVRPFQDLDRFPLPEAEHMRAVGTLAGRTYPAALAVLNQDLAAGIDAAAAGDPAPLTQARTADALFGLLRRRAAAMTGFLDKVDVADLAPFSLPAKPWAQFLQGLDARIRAAMVQYAKEGRGQTPWLHLVAEWDELYKAVPAAQRLTLGARLDGEKDLEFLLRNLEQAAAATPAPRTVHAWIVGYHLAEAVYALGVGFDAVCAWHRAIARPYVNHLAQAAPAPPRS